MAEFTFSGMELAGQFSARFAQMASGVLAGMADALEKSAATANPATPMRHTVGMMRELPRLQEIAAVFIRHGLGEFVQRIGIAGVLERAGQILHAQPGRRIGDARAGAAHAHGARGARSHLRQARPGDGDARRSLSAALDRRVREAAGGGARGAVRGAAARAHARARALAVRGVPRHRHARKARPRSRRCTAPAGRRHAGGAQGEAAGVREKIDADLRLLRACRS